MINDRKVYYIIDPLFLERKQGFIRKCLLDFCLNFQAAYQASGINQAQVQTPQVPRWSE
jgi:hypothetical protein